MTKCVLKSDMLIFDKTYEYEWRYKWAWLPTRTEQRWIWLEGYYEWIQKWTPFNGRPLRHPWTDIMFADLEGVDVTDLINDNYKVCRVCN
jgi:hypothetical protein